MSYQEKFEINLQNSTYLSKQFNILVTGSRDDNDRHNCFRKSMCDFSGQIYRMDTCENSEKFHYKIETSSGELIEEKNNQSLIPGLQTLLVQKLFEGQKICIDITGLKQGLMFLLIKVLLKDVKPARLFAAYTEPTDYLKRRMTEIGETEEYDLYDRIIGSSSGVPGFTKRESQKDVVLIAPIGFDSQRLQTIYENIKPKKLIPVVGFPSFSPGWNLTAVKMNYLILKNADCFDLIETCEASSPFAIYDLLKAEFDRHNSNYDIYVSPLGTRPHCLGAAIFVTRNPSAYLIYDFPLEKKYRSENILRTNIYNISKYIL